MSTNTPPELDRFETALLHELRGVVAANGHLAPAQAATRRRRTWAASLGGVATVGAGALAINLLTATPAWSVDVAGSGAVRVEVNRLEGASALEKALAEHGITARVTYLPPGQACAEGRYTDVTPSDTSLSIGSEQIVVELPPGAVGRGETFVLSAAVETLPDETRPDGTELSDGHRAIVDFGVAQGAVGPCTPGPA